ncbi:hypothetical protein [Bradyrhizobium diversitatis]|uniref:Uncharacterized protein n=1 Tax=Bradyrhizobium diversitatis TaxID=2755406 RepID=A0ABS0NUU8_9BRAD|nr:hypothetical protein [Bradyrhizobium diversitatis]KYK46263.1 hypothetical protein A1D31_32880 [Bradyrhizobium liaoningense]MBH5384784.1 hypothetical protein [Bradyrhizobium diversitatis]
MRGEQANAVGEALLRRLKRLMARAATVKGGDRKQLLVLLDDVETIRRGLVREAAEIDGEMRQTAARTAAIGAYLRNSQGGRGKRNN